PAIAEAASRRQRRKGGEGGFCLLGSSAPRLLGSSAACLACPRLVGGVSAQSAPFPCLRPAGGAVADAVGRGAAPGPTLSGTGCPGVAVEPARSAGGSDQPRRVVLRHPPCARIGFLPSELAAPLRRAPAGVARLRWAKCLAGADGAGLRRRRPAGHRPRTSEPPCPGPGGAARSPAGPAPPDPP